MSSTSETGGYRPAAAGPPGTIDGRRVIAIFKFIKAILLVLTSYGVHKLLDPQLIDKLHVWSATVTDRVDQRLILKALSFVEGLGADKLHLVMAVTIAYTAVVLLEGTGLWLRRRWGEWVTLIATCSLVPFELWELIHRPPGRRWTVAATLVVNLIIAAYLAHLVRTAHKQHLAAAP
ncbi:MAG TPA: DUF2127 domain-containing protein [Steroidobacteraceae bacterium]|jgi:uncharacterized membrane protein (DUF2068 family)